MGQEKRKRRLTKILLSTGALLLFCLPGQTVASPAPQDERSDKRARLLVIAPHPDDEALAGSALIQQTLRAGGSVRVAVMTNGDGFRRATSERFRVKRPQADDFYHLGLVRQQEALTAIGKLGLNEQDIRFLGYPDAGLKHLWNQNWSVHHPYRALNGHRSVPYQLAYRTGSPYSGESVVADLQRLFREYNPTDVLYPDPHDVHGDHWGTSAFTQYALSGLGLAPKEWTYLIHYPKFPVPRSYHPYHKLCQPKRLSEVGTRWHYIPLDHEQIAKKRSAIMSHQTQVHVMKSLLTSFVRKNDLIGSSEIQRIPSLSAREQPLSATGLRFAQQIDPIDDQRGNRSTDIRRLAVYQTAERLHLCLELARPFSKQHQIIIRLRLPDATEGTISQLSLKLDQNNVKTSTYPDLVSRIESHIEHELKDRFFRLSLPRDSFRNARIIMMQTEVRNGKSVDDTAWKRLYL